MTTTPLTPEAVASLTDAELSEAVARVVLQLPTSDLNLPKSAVHSPPCAVVFPGGWVEVYDPTTLDRMHLIPDNPLAVDRVREHMRQRWASGGALRECWRWKMEASAAGEWYVYVLDHRRNFVSDFVDKSLGRAIFAAALLAAQEMEKEG